MWCHVASCDAMLCLWCHVVLCDVMEYGVMSYLYAVCSTSGDPPCVYGQCIRGQCACLPLVEGDTCDIGAVGIC